MNIISFYENKTPDHKQRYLIDYLLKDDDWLESEHDFIQFMFPNKEASFVNPNAPTLTDEVISQFKSRDDLKYFVKVSLYKMVRFLKMDDEHPFWCTENNHNYLRITRIINMLNDLDMRYDLDDFYFKLMMVYDNNKEVIGDKTLSYWVNAYYTLQDK